MKKITTIVYIILISLFVTTTISSANASIQQIEWRPIWGFKGLDNSIYQINIIAYEAGSTATILIPVYDDTGNPIIVSSVKVEFDWGVNYTSTEVSLNNPVSIPNLSMETFTVMFTVPSTTSVLNTIAHTYKIYVELINATSGPKRIVDTWVANWDTWFPSYKFVVFSPDQVIVTDLNFKYNAYKNAFPPGIFTSRNASLVAGQAEIDGAIGQQYYASGNFSLAKSHLQKAINLYLQAIIFERKYSERNQEAQINQTVGYAEYYKGLEEQSLAQASYYEAQTDWNKAYYDAQTDYLKAQVDWMTTYYAAQTDYYEAYTNYYKVYADSQKNQGLAALNQSIAWLLFGAASIITGVGLFRFLSKRSKTP